MTKTKKTSDALPSALKYLKQLESGQLSSLDLVKQTLDRIHAVDDKLNAVVAENTDLVLNRQKRPMTSVPRESRCRFWACRLP
jgi:Asp-tRNA(Asn)/Glu-tRNA(Gln) amidotransferase A subunit family amidase